MRLRLNRAICFFDLETTGTDPARDRIVEIAVLRIEPDGAAETRTRRIHPERPIPPEATAIHGIRDEDVSDAPTFRQVARSLLDFFGDADLGGFNVRRFDVPLLDREFRDCGLDLAVGGRRVVDAMTIFHKKEPRDLGAAVRFFLGREHVGAHGAEADVRATFDVLEAQLARYHDLPDTPDGIEAWLLPPAPPDAADRSGKFVVREGAPVFNFGKHRGRPLALVAAEAPDYLRWLLQGDFPDDAKALVRQALGRRA